MKEKKKKKRYYGGSILGFAIPYTMPDYSFSHPKEMKWFLNNYPESRLELGYDLKEAITKSRYTFKDFYRICRSLKESFNENVPIDDHLNLIVSTSKESYLDLRKGLLVRKAILMSLGESIKTIK